LSVVSSGHGVYSYPQSTASYIAANSPHPMLPMMQSRNNDAMAVASSTMAPYATGSTTASISRSMIASNCPPTIILPPGAQNPSGFSTMARPRPSGMSPRLPNAMAHVPHSQLINVNLDDEMGLLEEFHASLNRKA
jgi:hypothetical protein